MQSMESMAANDETLGAESTHTVTVPPPESVGGDADDTADAPTQNQPTHHHPVGHRAHRAHIHAANTNAQANSRTNRGATLKRVRSFYTPYMEDRLARRLKFFFMGPHEKVKAKRKCPWKLIIQVLKIILVTIQVNNSIFISTMYYQLSL